MIIITLAWVIISSQGLITNGTFEQDLTIGWTAYMADSLYGYDTLLRGTDYEPDPDYEVMSASHFGYFVKLYQTVDIPSVNSVSFSVNAKLIGEDNNADALCWGAAAVVISYLNASGTVLGQTRICQFSDPCPWQNTSTLHLITVADTLWHTYYFALSTELINLPGVSPSQVAKVQVALYDTTAHTC